MRKERNRPFDVIEFLRSLKSLPLDDQRLALQKKRDELIEDLDRIKAQEAQYDADETERRPHEVDWRERLRKAHHVKKHQIQKIQTALSESKAQHRKGRDLEDALRQSIIDRFGEQVYRELIEEARSRVSRAR